MTQQRTQLNTEQNTKGLFSIGEIAVLLFVFLAALNFINRFAYCIFIAIALLLLFGVRTLKINMGLLPLLVFSLSLALFWEGANSSLTAFIRAFAYPLCFIVGNNLPLKQASLPKREKAFKVLAVVLALGAWVHLVLNMILNSGQDPEDTTRNTVDFWLGDTLSATGQAALACLMVGVAVAVILSNTKVWQKLCAFTAVLVIVYYNLTLAGRTILVILAAVFAIGFLYYIKYHKMSTRTWKLIFMIVLLIVALMLAYSFNVLGLKDAVEDSNFYDRFFGDNAMELGEETRSDAKLIYLENMFDYPFGGANIRDIARSYSHDLYFDTYDEAGVFAFLAIVIVVISATVKSFKVIRNKRVSFETKQMILCLITALHLEFWVEPILAGMAWLLACFCMLYGAIYRIETELKNEERELLL